MKKALFPVLIATLVLGSSLALGAEDNVSRQRLDARVNEVNHLGKQNNMLPLALDRIATETGIPRREVESMHKRHPDVGPGGVLIAGVLADETKKPAEGFLKQRDGGKSWEAMARENHVSYDKLTARLDRLEKAMGSAEKKSDKNQNQNQNENRNKRRVY